MQFPLKKLNFEFPHEKLCPKLYKAHAPAGIVRELENFTVEWKGEKAKPEVVKNFTYGKVKGSTILWKVDTEKFRNFPVAVMNIRQWKKEGGEWVYLAFVGMTTRWETKVFYKGERKIRQRRGSKRGGVINTGKIIIK